MEPDRSFRMKIGSAALFLLGVYLLASACVPAESSDPPAFLSARGSYSSGPSIDPLRVTIAAACMLGAFALYRRSGKS
jgi:hypothetical protein